MMAGIAPRPRPSDSWELIPLSEQFANHDEFRPHPTGELAATALALRFADGPVVRVEFEDETRLTWSADAPTAWGCTGAEQYEAVRVRDGVFALTVARLHEDTSALVVLDKPRQRALLNLTTFAKLDAEVSERTAFFQAGLDAALAAPFERTTELVGKRVAHRYSTTHVFEHIYLNPNTYAFQGLAGPEAGVADVDRADYWKLGEQLYLLSWHERAQPFNGAVVIDLIGGRATGRLVGWDSGTSRTLQVRTGSLATLLSTTTYGAL